MLDGCHPLNAGYQLYAESVQAFLQTALQDPQFFAPRPLPPALEAARLKTRVWWTPGKLKRRVGRAKTSRWPVIPSSHRRECAANALEFEFEGRAVGLYWLKQAIRAKSNSPLTAVRPKP
jgi:hypothetical protein